MKTAASETAGGREMVRSESSSSSVPRTDVREASGIVLDPAQQGGKVMDRAFASVEKFLETAG